MAYDKAYSELKESDNTPLWEIVWNVSDKMTVSKT